MLLLFQLSMHTLAASALLKSTKAYLALSVSLSNITYTFENMLTIKDFKRELTIQLKIKFLREEH